MDATLQVTFNRIGSSNFTKGSEEELVFNRIYRLEDKFYFVWSIKFVPSQIHQLILDDVDN
jgi:hypothetical protein